MSSDAASSTPPPKPGNLTRGNAIVAESPEAFEIKASLLIFEYILEEKIKIKNITKTFLVFKRLI